MSHLQCFLLVVTAGIVTHNVCIMFDCGSIVCGSDDRKNMRIPMQCVANDDMEHADFKVKHRKIDNRDIEPCTQALHVGCARWGNPSCEFKQVFYCE